MTATLTKPKAAKKRRFELTDEQRAERHTADLALAKASVEALQSSEGWTSWLETRSKFHNYSFGNQLLIALQRPAANHIAGFRKWLDLGYSVRKGEKGARIWAPCPPSKKRLAEYGEALAKASAAEGTQLEGNKPRTFFRLVAVFGDDQVDPLPEPAKPAPLSCPIVLTDGDSHAGLLPRLTKFGKAIGSTTTFEPVPGSAHGFYTKSTKAIVVDSELPANAQVKTLLHELAHALVRADKQNDDPELTYEAEELIAESVAFTVLRSTGLDTTGYSIPYLASWSSETGTAGITKHAGLVNRLACRLEDAIGEGA